MCIVVVVGAVGVVIVYIESVWLWLVMGLYCVWCLVVLVVVLVTVCRAKGAVVLGLYGPRFAHASVLELV